MRQLYKFVHLSWSDQFLLVQITILLLVIRFGLQVFSFNTVQKIIDRCVKNAKVKAGSVYPKRMLWAIRTAARRVAKARPCLPQALAAQLLLRRKGYSATLRIGVAKSDRGDLHAHAWVESNGAVVIGGDSSPKVYRVIL